MRVVVKTETKNMKALIDAVRKAAKKVDPKATVRSEKPSP